MKRKCNVIFAVMLCMITLLAACSAPNTKTKLYIGFWPDGTLEGETQFYLDMKEDFERAYPQYEIVPSSYDYSDNTVTAKYVSGQLPTVFSVDFDSAATPLKNGYVKDVGDTLKAYGWYDKIDADVLSRISDGDSVYGVPAGQYATGFLVNLKMLYEAGVIGKDDDGMYALYDAQGNALYPNTFDKISAAAEKVCAHYGNDVKAFCVPTAGAECGRLFLNHLYNFGSGDIEKREGNGWQADFNVEKMGAALRWIKNMAQEGYIDNVVSYGNNDWVSLFAQRKTAMAFCRSDILKVVLSAYEELKDEVAFLPMPSVDGEISRSLWGGSVYAINNRATEKQTEGVLAFLSYIGKTPSLNERTKSAIENVYKTNSEKGMALYPDMSVWEDEAYSGFLMEAFLTYKNSESLYFEEFFTNYKERRRADEPYYRTELYAALNELQKTMIFNPNRYDIVELIQNAENAFTEEYLTLAK